MFFLSIAGNHTNLDASLEAHVRADGSVSVHPVINGRYAGTGWPEEVAPQDIAAVRQELERSWCPLADGCYLNIARFASLNVLPDGRLRLNPGEALMTPAGQPLLEEHPDQFEFDGDDATAITAWIHGGGQHPHTSSS